MGKERNTRNILLYLAAYAVFFLTLLVVLRPEIKSNLTGHGYMEALEEYKNILLEGERTNLEIALYSIEGITRAEAESKTGFTDIDHLRIEALLSAPTDENLKEGLITYIDKDTRLVGLSIDDDIAYIALSDDFLSSPDIGKAKSQIEETLRIGRPELRVAIIVDDKII